MGATSRFRRHRGGEPAQEPVARDDVLTSLFEPSPLVGVTTEQGVSSQHPADQRPIDEPTSRAPWPTRLRQHARHHVPAVIAAVVLMLGAAATLLAPVQGSSCPTTLLALTATSSPLPGGVAPAQATGEVTVDNQAISSAGGQVSDAQSAVDAAEAAQSAASSLQEKADAAQAAADEASDAQDPFASDSAQWDVDDAEMTLEWAQDDLDSSESMLATDTAEGWDTTYDEEAVADAKAAVKDATAALAKANAALAAEQGDAESAASDARSRQKTADALAKKAQGAQEKADTDQAAAEDALSNAQSKLSDAEATQATHRQAAQVRAALWSHQHHSDLFAVRATNTTIADCRGAATKNAGVGAGLLIAAALLLVVDAWTAWRRSTADASTPAAEAEDSTDDADTHTVEV